MEDVLDAMDDHRRVVPGEYLAADPKGRAVMAASTEKNKLVYVLTRHGQTDIAISSPLEANKPQTLVFFLLGLDVGYDNPMFATLEVDYSASEADPTDEAYNDIKKELVYYELDLGLKRERTELSLAFRIEMQHRRRIAVLRGVGNPR